MQILIRHKVQGELVLPLNYHHIIQAIIYKNLQNSYGFESYMHNQGFGIEDKHYKMFTFGPLSGKYKIIDKKIIFTDTVTFEVRSSENFLIQILRNNIKKNGLYYEKTYIKDVDIFLSDYQVEEQKIIIKMQSPIVVHQTDIETRKTYFLTPDDPQFYEGINDNFKRKYTACYGIPSESNLEMSVLEIKPKDKYVTKYKGFYITGWKGKYEISGERKCLDFLYQVGIGSKNAQGFGMFDIEE